MKPPFKEVVDKYINLIYFFALRWSRKEEVDDMVQNTFLKAFKAYDNFNFQSEGQLKSWLLTICRNTAIDKGRSKMPVKLDFEDFEAIASSEDAEELLNEIIAKDDVQRIIEKLETMEPIHQEIVRLRIFEDLRFEEIGRALGLSEPATKMKFYRVIQRLKENI